MPSTFSLRSGCAYSFLYPRYNYFGLPDRTERRRVVVESVRDVKREPLDPVTTSLNPTLKRGRWLVTGRDLDRDATRTFYADSMKEVHPMTESDQEPMQASSYVVLTPMGKCAFHSSRLKEAIAYLLGRRTGVLCKILGFGPNALTAE